MINDRNTVTLVSIRVTFFRMAVAGFGHWTATSVCCRQACVLQVDSVMIDKFRQQAIQ